MPAPATPDAPAPDTLQIVRDNVRAMLTKSASFRSLPAEKQRQVAHDTVKVARFISDAGGDTAGVPMLAMINNPAASLSARPSRSRLARPFADITAPSAPSAPGQNQQNFDPASANYSSPAVDNLAGQSEAFIDAVDFPGFVAELIKGVFTAIVKTSIQQMEAYATLVANVSKSVDQYMADNVSPEQAKDQLVTSQPDLFEPDMGGETPTVKQRADANPDQMGGFLKGLGLPFDLDTSNPEVVQQEVVPAVRTQMAMDRQKLLATMVMMGINRIVVTDGRIQAAVVFDLSAKDIQQRNYNRATSFQEDYERRTKTKKQNGWWIFSTESETDRSLLNIKTSTTTNQTDTSTSALELKAKLTGNVDLRFKSDYFPMEKMLEMLGTNQTALTQVSQRPTPAQTAQAAAAPPLPALPPIPPAPTAGGALR
jgi:hypothetical protein